MSEKIRVSLVPECSSCIIDSLRTLVPLLTDDEEKQFEYFRLAYDRISVGFKKGLKPLDLSVRLYQELYELADADDPYAELKIESVNAAKKALPIVNERVQQKRGFEKLRYALAASIAGNVIDFNTAGHKPNLSELVAVFDDIVKTGFAIDDSKYLWQTMTSRSGALVVLADNAGETLFDIPLLRISQDLGWKATYVVKGRAMVNDATREDVMGTGLEDFASIAVTGAWAHGVPKALVSKEFLDVVRESQLVISKGQANIESFPEIQEDTGVETYYVTRGKCPHISKSIGAKKGDNVVLRRPSLTT